jgi:uncharacterized phage-associated protein
MKAIDLGHIVTHYINQKGDSISHKKLQKLIYYVEAWHLVNFDKPLIDEDFEAWVHGPVIPQLYQKLKEFGFNKIEVINDEYDSINEEINALIKKNRINTEQVELINSVLDRYGSLTSFELELLTHNEKPWIETRKGVPPHVSCNDVISKSRMKEFYSSLN